MKRSERGSADSFKVKADSQWNDDKDHDQQGPDRERHLGKKGKADVFRGAARNTAGSSAAALSVPAKPQEGGGREEATRNQERTHELAPEAPGR